MRPNLIEARQRKGLTQKQLGNLIGLSKQTISSMEKGRVQGKVATWQALASALDLPLEDLWRQADGRD